MGLAGDKPFIDSFTYWCRQSFCNNFTRHIPILDDGCHWPPLGVGNKQMFQCVQNNEYQPNCTSQREAHSQNKTNNTCCNANITTKFDKDKQPNSTVNLGCLKDCGQAGSEEACGEDKCDKKYNPVLFIQNRPWYSGQYWYWDFGPPRSFGLDCDGPFCNNIKIPANVTWPPACPFGKRKDHHNHKCTPTEDHKCDPTDPIPATMMTTTTLATTSGSDSGGKSDGLTLLLLLLLLPLLALSGLRLFGNG